eukprot:TRINITY_DN36487_c0_g2_i1.p1 TRINITY_DN36487_c0_g2~~TRINITY_DN36487_c0_g2_i1.p1  ORF type:complete len:380 (-),score=88.46 TRINITY_DN36487_c0_g2_i1:63-1202(-)
MASLAESERYRQELREAVMAFALGQAGPDGQAPSQLTAPLPKQINVYLFGPQGSGKTSFVRSAFRALYGKQHLTNLEQQETSLQRSDDGTSMYSVYSLTERVVLHDTRGQREYTREEMAQLKLVLEGRARPNTLIQQRRRYWLLLREFWRTDEQMLKTFSRTVMTNKSTLETEPHFSFLVLDPNQQELLLEDEDFAQCYGNLLNDFSDRGVPHALLCTHGDTLTASSRQALLGLPAKLGCKPPVVPGQAPQPGPGGVLRPAGPSASGPPGAGGNSAAAWGGDGGYGGAPGGGAPAPAPSPPPPQRMPDVIRIVTNYVESVVHGPHVEIDADGNDIHQDIHTLLVLLDSLRQADHQIMQRLTGKRPAPMPPEAELGCPLL